MARGPGKSSLPWRQSNTEPVAPGVMGGRLSVWKSRTICICVRDWDWHSQSFWLMSPPRVKVKKVSPMAQKWTHSRCSWEKNLWLPCHENRACEMLPRLLTCFSPILFLHWPLCVTAGGRASCPDWVLNSLLPAPKLQDSQVTIQKHSNHAVAGSLAWSRLAASWIIKPPKRERAEWVSGMCGCVMGWRERKREELRGKMELADRGASLLLINQWGRMRIKICI